jgi:DNA polymerase III subunit epsilon
MEIVAVDFETADYGADSACAIGLARVVDGVVVADDYHLIRPPRRSFAFTYIHGIRWGDVADKPSFGELWPEIADFIGSADRLAAHNAPFDRKVLASCCRAADIKAPRIPFICTVQIARGTWDVRPTKLPDVCSFLGIDLDHHNAASDAIACARIVAAALTDGYSVPP